jgi:hypothetical protein
VQVDANVDKFSPTKLTEAAFFQGFMGKKFRYGWVTRDLLRVEGGYMDQVASISVGDWLESEQEISLYGISEDVYHILSIQSGCGLPLGTNTVISGLQGKKNWQIIKFQHEESSVYHDINITNFVKRLPGFTLST